MWGRGSSVSWPDTRGLVYIIFTWRGVIKGSLCSLVIFLPSWLFKKETNLMNNETFRFLSFKFVLIFCKLNTLHTDIRNKATNKASRETVFEHFSYKLCHEPFINRKKLSLMSENAPFPSIFFPLIHEGCCCFFPPKGLRGWLGPNPVYSMGEGLGFSILLRDTYPQFPLDTCPMHGSSDSVLLRRPAIPTGCSVSPLRHSR